MKRKSLLRMVIAIAIGCCFFGCSPSLEAQSILYVFSGDVDASIPGNSNFVGFTGQFTIDQNEPDQDPSPLLFVIGGFELPSAHKKSDPI